MRLDVHEVNKEIDGRGSSLFICFVKNQVDKICQWIVNKKSMNGLLSSIDFLAFSSPESIVFLESEPSHIAYRGP